MDPPHEVHVAAICGSLRDDSRTRTALRVALDAAEAAGAETTLVDLREYDLPPIDADDGDAGDAPALRQAVAEADAVLLGTPNYHGSFSAPLKNALDYCGRDEFGGTTVGLLEVAGGSFPTRPLEHLRTVCRTLNAWTLPHEVGMPNSASTVRDGEIVDDRVAARVAELGETAVRYAGVDRYPELVAGADEGALEPTVGD
ncbi:NADPH-dependent FMN reductase [Halobium salinum]|uniref:NADPH-dependent FMN reductase n=1 Tax=Halobium salinum TaxID=1364940 RepID=A0ABD5PDQ3_9EURY|nr:NAD(P)H-dependent oxidoreductase [Halobium salinum]